MLFNMFVAAASDQIYVCVQHPSLETTGEVYMTDHVPCEVAIIEPVLL